MGKIPTFEAQYEIQHMWEIHEEIARRLAIGEKPQDIAKELDITPQMVSYTRNSGIVQAYMANLKNGRNKSVEEIHEQIVSLAPKAVQHMEDMMDDDMTADASRVAICRDLLDRAGLSPIKKIAIAHGSLTKTDIEDMKMRAREEGQRRGNMVIDVGGNGKPKESTDESSQV